MTISIPCYKVLLNTPILIVILLTLWKSLLKKSGKFQGGHHDKIYWKSRGSTSKKIDILNRGGTIFSWKSPILKIRFFIFFKNILHIFEIESFLRRETTWMNFSTFGKQSLMSLNAESFRNLWYFDEYSKILVLRNNTKITSFLLFL